MRKPFVTTVLGEIAAEDLGLTLSHEHLYCDISVHSGKADNILQDVGLIVEEMAFFKKAGGNSVVELTPEGIGRNPRQLREISSGSGVHVISGMAFYDQSTYPDWVANASTDLIADYFVEQIEEGENGVPAQRIAELVRQGYARKIPLSTDTCRLSQMHAHGGRGYDYLWTSFLPRLRRLGVTETEIHLMLVEAPRAFLERR